MNFPGLPNCCQTMRELGRCTCLPDADDKPFSLEDALANIKASMEKPIGRVVWVVTKAEEKVLNSYGITTGYMVAEDLK